MPEEKKAEQLYCKKIYVDDESLHRLRRFCMKYNLGMGDALRVIVFLTVDSHGCIQRGRKDYKEEDSEEDKDENRG